MARGKINLTDHLGIFNLLRRLQSSKVTVWVFPDLNELTEKSPIHLGRLSKIEYDRVEVRPSAGNNFTFESVENLMFFFREDEIGFKTKIIKILPEMISIPLPKEVFSIDESELEKVPLFNKIATTFREKRLETRKSPRDKKFVMIAKDTTSAFKKGVSKRFELLDLSPSGMGIRTLVADDFQIGDEIEVRSIDGKEEIGTIYGEIKSVRELNTGGYKVGILFLERKDARKKAQ